MSRTAHLVYIPGYPLYPEVFMPRHRLAYLAGNLLQAGHDIRIHDFGTVSNWEAVYPSHEGELCQTLLERFGVGGYGQPLSIIKQLWQLRRAAKAFRDRRTKWALEQADRLTQQGGADALIFELCNADDVDLLGEILPAIRRARPSCVFGAMGPMADAYPGALSRSVPELDAIFPEHALNAVESWLSMADEPGRWVGIANAWVCVGGTWGQGPRNGSVHDTEPGAYGVSVYPAMAGHEKLKLFTIEDYQGCSCHCNACAAPHHGEAKVADDAVQEVNELFAAHGATAFHFSGMGAPASHALAVAQGLQDFAKPAVRFSRDLHTANAVPALFSGLKRAGCVAIEFQMDTGSQRLLDNVFARGVKVSYAEKIAAAAHEHGLGVNMRFTFPTPDDDYHTRAETLRILSRTRPQGAPVDVPMVAETSHWHQDPSSFGFSGTGLPGRATFPLPADRWAMPSGSLGPYSPSQAIQQVDSLRAEIETMGVSTILSAQRMLLADVAGAGLRPAAFVSSFIEALGKGETDWIRNMVQRVNDQACFAVGADSSAPMRSAMGDGA